MDVSAAFERLSVAVEPEFTVTLEGVYLHISADRVRILDRLARFHGHTTTGEDLSQPSKISLFRGVC